MLTKTLILPNVHSVGQGNWRCGNMSIFGKLTKTLIHTATAPIDIVKDVATLGGVITEEDEPYSLQKAKKVLEDLDELGDEIDDL